MKFNSHLPKRSYLALSISAAISLTSASQFAFAQEEDSDDASLENMEEIVVTGSRIRRQDFEANSPIVTVDTTTFEETSTIGLDTVLNQLPQFIPGVLGGGNPNTQQQQGTGGSQFAAGGIGPNAFQTPGTSSVNLRGLGPGRNLVLLDGRRGMPVDASMTVDLNSIPASALERIEVVSGGASAVYGADAIAGAVNFILKDDFEGFNFNTNYGVTALGDAEEYRMSALFGANTSDGRGNVMVGLEHSHRGEGDYWERDWYRELRENPSVGGTDFFYSDTYVDGLLNGASVQNPVWTPTNGESWFITATDPAQQAALDGIFDELPPGTIPGNATFYMNKDGSVYTGAGGLFGASDRDGSYKYNGPLNVDGLPFRKFDPAGGIAQNQLENWISVPLDRYSIFARGKYAFTDSVSAFANVTYARSTTATESQYSPAVGGWNAQIPHGDGVYADSFLDTSQYDPNPTVFNPTTFANDPNPNFAPDGALTGYDPVTGAPIWRADAPTNPSYVANGALGLNCAATGGCTNTEAFPVPTELAALLATRSDPNSPFAMNRVLDFMGVRGSRNTTMNYQFQAGVEGETDKGFYWDVAFSYGESENQTKVINYGNLERYRSVVQSANYGRLFQQVGNDQGDGFSAGTGFCSSGLPIFGDFEVTQDCIDSISTTLTQSGIMEQSTFDANLGGDVMELPAGPVQFAVGVAARQNSYDFTTSDDLNPSNFGFSVIGLQPVNETHGQIKVREVYGELLIPIIDSGPVGMRNLNLELGGRHSDYWDTSGSVETYKFLVDWLVTDWMRFRGGVQKATRAPNIRELFIGRTQDIFNSTATYGDVCSLNNFDSALSAAVGVEPGSNPPVNASASEAQAAQTLSICESMMTPAGLQQYYARPLDEMPEDGSYGSVYVQGNPDVQPENADTLTAGLVFSSPFQSPALQGLSASLDWYQIEVEDMIASDVTDTIVERCFSLEENPTGDTTNRNCQLIRRDPSDGGASTLDISFSNETAAKLSGIDLQINWNAQFADLGADFIPGGIGINMLATVPLKFETQANGEADWIDWKGYQTGSGCPSGVSCTQYDYTMFTTFNWFSGPWNASLRWQHYPDIESGALATNPDSTAKGVLSDYDVFALTGAYRLTDSTTVSMGIENLFDTKPPKAGGNPDGTPFPTPPTYVSGGFYDPLGRRFYVSASFSF